MRRKDTPFSEFMSSRYEFLNQELRKAGTRKEINPAGESSDSADRMSINGFNEVPRNPVHPVDPVKKRREKRRQDLQDQQDESLWSQVSGLQSF